MTHVISGRMLFYDTGHVATRTTTPEGYLQVTARAGRTGVQPYYVGVDFAADQLPETLRGKTEIGLLRPPEEVFSPQALASFELKPVTIEHPSEPVTAENVKDHQVGIMSRVWGESDDVMAGLVVMDAEAIRQIEAGKTQVSLGYESDIDWTPGDGYDGVFRNIVGNHIAIVDRARAGSAYRLLDADRREQMEEEKKESEEKEMTDSEKLLKDELSAAQEKIKDLEDALSKLKATTDEAPKEDEIEKRVEDGIRERLEVVDAARAVVADLPVIGKSNTQIRLAVIDHLSGGKAKPAADNPEIVKAVFDALVAMPVQKTAQIVDGLRSSVVLVSDSDTARANMIARRNGGLK
jgi:uncharacterized protein